MGMAFMETDREAEVGTLWAKARAFVQCKVEWNNWSDARLYVYIGTVGLLRQDKDLLFPNRYTLPRVPSHYLRNRNRITSGKACATGDVGVMAYPTNKTIPNVWSSDFLSRQDLFKWTLAWLLQVQQVLCFFWNKVQQILSDTCKQDELGSP